MGIFNNSIQNLTGANSLLGLFQQVNFVTNGWFGIGVYFSMYVIIFMSMSRWPTRVAFASTSYTMFVLTVAFSLLGLIPGWLFSIGLALAIVGFLTHVSLGGGEV